MKHILIIEDDVNLGDSLVKIMQGEGFHVSLATTIADAKNIAISAVDIIILDWMLPDGQGIDFLKSLRIKNINIPVIMLTARAELIDKVLGLETGASDYITKPFESRELIARVRVQLRGKDTAKELENIISINKISLNLSAKEVLFDKKRIILTKMEFELLKILIENPRQIFSRENLLDKVWGYENFPTTRTVDTHVLQIRQKTESSIIETIRGLGYRFGLSD